MSQGDRLTLLHGPDVEKALAAEDVRTYEYVLNKPGLYLLTGLAGIFFAAAAYCWWAVGLEELVWMLAFWGAVAAGVASTLAALYWHGFARRRLVAVSDERLFVGARDSLWAIDWELLDPETMGFEQMELSKMRGVLEIDVGGQRIQLHLFNAFAVLEDLQGFILGVLERFAETE